MVVVSILLRNVILLFKLLLCLSFQFFWVIKTQISFGDPNLSENMFEML